MLPLRGSKREEQKKLKLLISTATLGLSRVRNRAPLLLVGRSKEQLAMAVLNEERQARMRSATARGGARKKRFFLATGSRQVSLNPSSFISLFHSLAPARHRPAPSNVPDVGLGALDVEDAEGLGDDGSHS